MTQQTTQKQPVNIQTSLNQEVSLHISKEFSISPNDDNDITIPGATIYISSSSSTAVQVKLQTVDSENAITRYLTPGYHALKVKRIFSTGTTLNGATIIGQL